MVTSTSCYDLTRHQRLPPQRPKTSSSKRNQKTSTTAIRCVCGTTRKNHAKQAHKTRNWLQHSVFKYCQRCSASLPSPPGEIEAKALNSSETATDITTDQVSMLASTSIKQQTIHNSIDLQHPK